MYVCVWYVYDRLFRIRWGNINKLYIKLLQNYKKIEYNIKINRNNNNQLPTQKPNLQVNPFPHILFPHFFTTF